MSPEALTMESTHCVTRAEKPLPWRIARKAKQCVRITCDAQSLPGQGARKASKPLPLRIARKAEYVRITCDVQPLPCHGARKAPKSLPLRFARKAECVRITCDAQSLPCQEARKAPKHMPRWKVRRAKCCALTSVRLMVMLAMLMVRSTTGHVQFIEMSIRKPVFLCVVGAPPRRELWVTAGIPPSLQPCQPSIILGQPFVERTITEGT